MTRLLAIALALAACRPPPVEDDGDDAPLPVSGNLSLVRAVRWPGAGRELTLRIDQPDAAGALPDLGQSISLGPAEAFPDDVIDVRRAALAPGYTAILVRPAVEGAARADQAEALSALIASRPVAERLALFRWGAEVEQVIGFTDDRDRLDAGIWIALANDGDEAADGRDAVLAVANEAIAVGGSGPRVMRGVVVLGGEIPDEARQLTPLALLAVDGADLVDQALAAGNRIDQLAVEAHYTVAVCAGAEPPIGALSVDGIEGELTIEWQSAWPESLGAPCLPEEIGVVPQATPQVVDLSFTEDQRAVYDSRVENVSKAEFDLSVRLAADQDFIVATAHLRGKGTLGCERKSYTVTLDGPGRHLFPDVYADEVYLIAMCGDDRYFQLYTSNQLMRELGLFPLAFRFVELTLDGELRGVYLMVEKVDDALTRNGSRVSAVLRRRFTGGDESIEVEKTSGDPAAASIAWNDFVDQVEELDGDQLQAALMARLDLGDLLRWLALMTAFENGDYVDEVWLTASDARQPDGDVEPSWDITGWDNDDLFSECHYSGKFAFDDPNGLSYCAEGRIDKAILGDAILYDRYVDALEEVLGAVTPEVVQAALDATGAELLPYFERPEICAAMTELLEDNPDAIEPEEAQRDIREHLDLLYGDYAARRALLLDRIVTYRAQ